MNSRSVAFHKVCLIALAVGLALTATSVLIAQASRWGAVFPATRAEPQLPQNPSTPGTITGTVYYTGTITGTHVVWIGAFTTTQGGPPVYATMRSGPGPYTLMDITEGVYTIMAGMDADDSGGSPNPAIDPMGLYIHNPVTVTAGVVTTGVDMILLDPTPPPTSTGSISGWISYTGHITASHHIIIFASRLGEQGPPTYATVIPGMGPYTITGVAPYTYTVGAFMDLGDDMGPPAPDEPFGWYDLNGDSFPEPVVVSESSPATEINISLYDPLRYIHLPLISKMVGP